MRVQRLFVDESKGHDVPHFGLRKSEAFSDSSLSQSYEIPARSTLSFIDNICLYLQPLEGGVSRASERSEFSMDRDRK